MLARLAGREYSSFAGDLARWAKGPDAPLRRVMKTVWRLTSPWDAWTQLAQHLDADDLNRFSEVVVEVLGARDPRLDLEPESRWAAALHGKEPPHSNWLRQGLAEGLVLLAVAGGEANVDRVSDVVGAAVRRLLDGADGPAWSSIAGLLSTLAEAAPREFLSAVQAGLAGDTPPVMDLFVDGGWMSGCSHAELLWGLEVLAWKPASRLGMVTSILGTLARLDPGGTYSNRPMESLRTIFLTWWPQTAASSEERLAAVERLVKVEHDVGWDLLIRLVETSPGVLSPNYKPRWRN